MTAGAYTGMWSRLHYRIDEPDDTHVLCKTSTYGNHMKCVWVSCRLITWKDGGRRGGSEGEGVQLTDGTLSMFTLG